MTARRAPGTGGGERGTERQPDEGTGRTAANRPHALRRLARRVTGHVQRRLGEMERAEPDGAVATWRWMWRALERTSDSVWRLRLRFTAGVVADLVLLATWWCLRPFAYLRRGSPRRAVVTAGALGLLCAFLWLEEQRAGPRLPYALLEVHASGLLTFGGQNIHPRELEGIVDHYRISVLDLSVDGDVSYATMDAVQEILADAGIPRVKVRMKGTEDDLRTRR